MEEFRKSVSEYSTAELRVLCQGTAPDPARESLIGRLTRVLSIYTTRLFLHTSITPNQITTISVLVFFLGILCFFSGEQTFRLIGSILVFFSIVLDGSDGETARFRNIAGRAGSNYVEPVSHDIQYGISFFLLGIAMYAQTGIANYIVLGGSASIFKLLYRFLEIRYWNLRNGLAVEKERIKQLKDLYQKLSAPMRVFYFLNKNIYSQNGNFLLLFLASVTNRLDLFIWFYGVSYILLWFALFAKQIYQLNVNPL